METQIAPVVVAPSQTVANAVPAIKPEKTTNDIIKQISSIKLEAAKEEPVISPINLDEIKDPIARAFVEKRTKERESGGNKTVMDAANQRKEAEKQICPA